MQCGRLPNAAVRDRDRPDAHLDPAAAARPATRPRPRRAIGCGACGYVCGSPHGQSWPATGSSRSSALERSRAGPGTRSASRRRRRRASASRSRTGGSAARSRRSASSSRRRRRRSCSCPSRPGRCRRSCACPSSRARPRPSRRETQSRSGSQNGPFSRITIRQPARASRCASVTPPAPAPTTTRSTVVAARGSAPSGRGSGARAGAGRAGTPSRCPRASAPSP